MRITLIISAFIRIDREMVDLQNNLETFYLVIASVDLLVSNFKKKQVLITVALGILLIVRDIDILVEISSGVRENVILKTATV